MLYLFAQGGEEIIDKGTIQVDYYLMTEIENDYVVDPTETRSFGYCAEHDHYFELHEKEALEQLRTYDQVDNYVVAAFYPPDASSVISLDELLPPHYREAWRVFHRRIYG